MVVQQGDWACGDWFVAFFLLDLVSSCPDLKLADRVSLFFFSIAASSTGDDEPSAFDATLTPKVRHFTSARRVSFPLRFDR